jgi:hypothetical protein
MASPVVASGTLFLVALPELRSPVHPAEVLRGTKYASHCGTGNLTGHWIRLSNDELSFFVVTFESGGTAGREIQVFQHRFLVTPSKPTEQLHLFERVWTGYSRIQPFFGDTDADGAPELFVAAEVTNLSGASGTPRVYRVLRWNNGKLEETKQLSERDMERVRSRLSPL